MTGPDDGWILAFDTALNGCSVALLSGDKSFRHVEAMGRGQSEKLLPMVDALLAEAKIDFQQIGMIATTRGPGAFTGLRIGLSTARALGLALQKPVFGVTTLEVLARSFFEDHADAAQVCVLLDTKRKDFYVQFFSRNGLDTGEPMVASPESLQAVPPAHIAMIGDGAPLFERAGWERQEGYELPDPVMVARIAREKMERGEPSQFVPLYLRDAEVSFPKNRGK
jgi:tRNA threonylcarbamoyladenosine biosynthesis protein TsaB